jgi:hypothetical protein
VRSQYQSGQPSVKQYEGWYYAVLKLNFPCADHDWHDLIDEELMVFTIRDAEPLGGGLAYQGWSIQGHPENYLNLNSPRRAAFSR